MLRRARKRAPRDLQYIRGCREEANLLWSVMAGVPTEGKLWTGSVVLFITKATSKHFIRKFPAGSVRVCSSSGGPRLWGNNVSGSWPRADVSVPIWLLGMALNFDLSILTASCLRVFIMENCVSCKPRRTQFEMSSLVHKLVYIGELPLRKAPTVLGRRTSKKAKVRTCWTQERPFRMG